MKHSRFTLLLGIGAAVLLFRSPSAHAQHVVTDYEASKLTFAALTASPPPVHHRHMVKNKSGKSLYRQVSYNTTSHSSGVKGNRLVRRVSYKHKPSSQLMVRSGVYRLTSTHRKTLKHHS